jgi:hypothetical protein
MKLNDIIGSWKLTIFEITTSAGVTKPWGNNSHGLLIYTPAYTMSVSINKDIEGDSTNPANRFNSILFYSGTYELKDGVITHHVTNASDPDRIGKLMMREASINGDVLTLIGSGTFGSARLIWSKRHAAAEVI